MKATSSQSITWTWTIKVLLALTMVGALVALVLPIAPASASDGDHAGTGKVTFCHRTNAAENPYVLVTTDPASIVKRGHTDLSHQGPVFDPLVHTQEFRGWGDVIPPFDYDSVATGAGSFAGTANVDWANNTTPIEELCFPAEEPPIVPEAVITVEKTAAGAYDRDVTWDLVKTVDSLESQTFSGNPGDSFPITWEVTATKTDSGVTSPVVTGDIEITYSTNVELEFTVDDVMDDGTVGVVDCPTNVMPEGADVIICTYEATPADASATLNTATVSLVDPPDNIIEVGSDMSDDAAVAFTETLTGDDSVALTDPRTGYDQTISATTSPTSPETFTCPTTRSSYDSNRLYSATFTNTAYLDGANTDLEDSASVTLNCEWELVFAGDSVTGAGLRWSARPGAPNTWFQYTNMTSGTANLVQGRTLLDVGDVTFTPNGDGTTTLAFTMASGWELKDVAGNVKVQPLQAQPPKYKQPGAFSQHFTRSGSTFSVTVPSGAYGYAIHLDAGRWVEATY